MTFKKGHKLNVGENNPMFGRKHSEESKRKMLENNPHPLKENVKYIGLHEWIRKRLQKPDICPCCEEKPVYDIACYTGIYDRDLDNYVYLCRSCHMKLDYATGERTHDRKVYIRTV